VAIFWWYENYKKEHKAIKIYFESDIFLENNPITKAAN